MMKLISRFTLIISMISYFGKSYQIDYSRGYSFLEVAVKSDLVALVEIEKSLYHGYCCKLEDVLFTTRDIEDDAIWVWTNDGISSGKKSFKPSLGEKYLLSLKYNDKDERVENDILIIIEKAGTYYLPEYGVSYLIYKNEKVSGRLIEPFGWIDEHNIDIYSSDEEYEGIFIEYTESEMSYKEYREILLKELRK